MLDRSRTVLLCKRGRLRAHAVTLDGSVTVREFPVRAWWHPEEFGLRPMPYKHGPTYPADQAAAFLLHAGKALGITEGARRLLDAVPRNQAPAAASPPDTGEAAASGQKERLPTQP